MTIKSSSSTHDDYKVFVSVEINNDKRDVPPSPMLKIQCNVRIEYVPNSSTDTTSIVSTDIIEDHDSWCSFDLPYDMFTTDDNFSSSQLARNSICQILDRMEIPFELDKLFWKQTGHRQGGKQYSIVPMEKPDDIVALITAAARSMADRIGVSGGKGLVMVVTVEKQVRVPRIEYVGMLKAKQENLFSEVRSKVVKMLQLEEQQGQEFPKSVWENVVDLVVKSGLGEAMQNYLGSLMKQKSK